MERLYTSLVRPILEYGSVLWPPRYRCHVDSIETVQKQCLLFALWGLFGNPHVHRSLLKSLPSLDKHTFVLAPTFLVKLLNVIIDTPVLLNEIKCNGPLLSQLSQCNFDCELFNSLRVLCKNLNDFLIFAYYRRRT